MRLFVVAVTAGMEWSMSYDIVRYDDDILFNRFSSHSIISI